MFFKNDPKANPKHADIACWTTFVFWGGLLLINSASESIAGKPFITDSLTILFSGLIIFFVTSFGLKVFSKTKKHN